MRVPEFGKNISWIPDSGVHLFPFLWYLLALKNFVFCFMELEYCAVYILYFYCCTKVRIPKFTEADPNFFVLHPDTDQ